MFIGLSRLRRLADHERTVAFQGEQDFVAIKANFETAIRTFA
jgi:hypothetical protein